MVVSTHNPSNLAMTEIEIKVPHGNFKVQKLVNHKWEHVDAPVACNAQYRDDDPWTEV